MPANLTAIGIQSTDVALVESFESEKKLQSALILDSGGFFGDAEAFDPTYDVSLSGRGSLPVAFALGIVALDVAEFSTGVTILNKVGTNEKNTDFEAWSASGMHFPGAS